MFRIVRTFNNIVVVISVATFYDINGVKVSAFVKKSQNYDNILKYAETSTERPLGTKRQEVDNVSSE